MIEHLRALLSPQSTDLDVAHHQYLLNIVLVGLAGPGLLFGLIMAGLWALGLAPAVGAILGFGVQPFYLLSYWLGRRGRVKLAAHIPATVVFLVMVASMFQVGIGHVSTVGLALVVVTAGILIGIGAASIFVLLSVAAYVLAGMAQVAGMVPTAVLPEATVALDAIGLGLGLSVLVVFDWLSNREMRRALQLERQLRATLRQQRQQLEQQVAERTIALTTANEQLQQEITERVRVEEEIKRRNKELEALNAIANVASRSLHLEEARDG